VAVAETYRPRLDAGAELIGGDVAKYGDFRRPVGEQGGGRGRCRHARSLACADDDDGVRCRQGCLRGEAANALRARGALDGRSGAAIQKNRAGWHAAAFRRALSEGARIGSRRKPRAACLSPVQLFPQRLTGFGNPPDGNPPQELDYENVARPAPSAPTIRIALSTTSAGSGITPADK